MGLVNLFGEIALEETLKNVQRGLSDAERRFEWQEIAGENKVKYIGVAPQGTLTSEPLWEISKFWWTTGPVVGTTVVERIQTAIGAWDARETLLP